jgi:hypothetical protein
MPRQFENRNLYDVIKTQGDTSITGSEVLTDPVGKLRVSTPQALIDTDFEYSTQSTKWESLNLMNNRASAFYDVTAPLTVTNVIGTGTVITVSTSAPPPAGTPIFVQGLTQSGTTTNGAAPANGWFVVNTVTAGTNFTYVSPNSIVTGVFYDNTKTYCYSGNFYSNAGIAVDTNAFSRTAASTTITGTTVYAHGLSVGDGVFVVGLGGGTPAPSGSFLVKTTPTVNTFTFTATGAPTANITNASGTTFLYARPFGSVIHRSFDGGVQFSVGYPYSGNQLIRQTRRYFRYQSGKGIQFSTGTTLKPAFLVDTLSSSGTTVTVSLKTPHNLSSSFSIGNSIQTTNSSSDRAFRSYGTGTATINGNVLNVTALATGSFNIGSLITGTGIAADTYITAIGSATLNGTDSAGGYGTGTYYVSVSQTVSSVSITGTNTTIYCNVAATQGNLLAVGDTIVVKNTTETSVNGTWKVASIVSNTLGSVSTFTFKVNNAPSALITCNSSVQETLYIYPSGPFITVEGATDAAYNGTFPVDTIPSDLTFTYTAFVTPTVTTAVAALNSVITVSPESWWVSKNRIGLFDEQNGFFFEFDGQTLYAVKRSCTTQITGTVSISNGTPSVTGNGTLFSSQLTPGDIIVIRGMTYNVQSIASDTSLFIYPEYRGSSVNSCIVSKRIEEKYPQSSWNLDTCDGKGPSGFNINLKKMQMLYIDYAWYGAGAIRFGFKDDNGNIFYAHRIPNSNRNTEAYMRSGNMCARYECNTSPVYTITKADVSSLAAVASGITVDSTAGFPPNGLLTVTSAGNVTSAIEYISYMKKTSTQFLGLKRSLTNYGTATLRAPGDLLAGGGTSSNQTFTYSSTAPTQVASFPGQFSSTLSHWGSAVIMDGRYDDDKSYIFQAGLTAPAALAASASNVALLSIRLAPSVDSGLTGILGARDLINRMQLTLRQMDVVATGSAVIFRVELILNGVLGGTGAGTFGAAGGSSLAQIATHSATGQTTITGGESIFSFFVYTPSVVQQDLTLVRDLGNCILGGGTSTTVPTSSTNLYPDGPDVVTVKVTSLTAAASTIAARLSWTEAQA